MEKDSIALASEFKKQKLGYQIDDIHIISFAANANALPGDMEDIEEDQLGWEINFNEVLFVEDELYTVSILLNLFYLDDIAYKKKRVGALEVNFDFKLQILALFYEKGEIPVDIKNNLLSIAISTIRGIWFAKVAGTEIEDVLVPLFIPTELRNEIGNDLGYRISLLEEYTELKNYTKAVEVGKSLYDEHPEDETIIDIVGFALVQTGDYEEALHFANKRLEIDPESAISLSNKGFILEKLGETEDALNNYRTALELDPNDLEIINRYLSLCLKSDRNEEIRTFIQSFESRGDESYTSLNVIAEYKRALNDYEGAIQTAHKAIVLDPKKWEAYITLALAYKSQGNIEEAVDQIKIALKLDADLNVLKMLPPVKEMIMGNHELKSLIE